MNDTQGAQWAPFPYVDAVPPMASKAFNKANLMTLDRQVLAELLLEAVKGDAARQRRVREPAAGVRRK
ncbi:DUF6880 family protein [uncultured Pseudosulfitobacter sp.]|uniref:DUF6880 family protein n=1 Tax=uncultured Pseudosulfitobacter sp. TaxID=2854214 RepID=UPI0030DD7AEB